MKRILCTGLISLLLSAGLAAAEIAKVENQGLRLEVDPADASARLTDKSTGEAWNLGAPRLMMQDKSTAPVRISGGITAQAGALRYKTEQGMEFQLQLAANPPSVEYSFSKPASEVAEVVLIDKGLQVEPGAGNYYALPVRMGILLYPEGDKPYTRRMANYGGYSMAMLGVVKNGSALLATWEDPYTAIVADYAVQPQRKLSLSLSLRKSATSVRFQPIGRGGYVEIAKAYRPIAKQRGYLKTLAEKMKENPGVARFFGAADFKPFAFMRTVPNTRYNRTDKERLSISFSFQECADLAEHLSRELGIDRALLVLNGWINGGYDNRHPDVLPAAPEIGGDEGLIECSRRVHALGSGWVLGLHDNYQDFYKDAKSWNEDYIMKNPDGSLHKGGEWAGGLAYLICSRKSVELADRPQNVPRVKELFKPDLYFSDTVFASPLYECSDPKHPLTWVDDLKYKTQLSDYLRKQVGLFGSEEGREWGVAHADYFEGLMSHKTRWQQQRPNDDIIVPMFEIVYGDAIPIYTHQSDRPRVDNPAYIVDHVLYGEMPVYQYGNHRYWTEPDQPSGRERPVDQARAIFAGGNRFNNATDRFIKNTYEVLSPLGRVTALLPMTDHRFVTPDRKVESTKFGSNVNVTVNYGESDYTTSRAVLPQYGFMIESPSLVAFYARSYGQLKYSEPTLFVIRSMDGKPLASSSRVRIFHGFGDSRIEFRGKTLKVETDTIVPGGKA